MHGVKFAALVGTVLSSACLALGLLAFKYASQRVEQEFVQLPTLLGPFAYENSGRYRTTSINGEYIYCSAPAYITFYSDQSCGEFKRLEGKMATATRLSYPTLWGTQAIVSSLTIDGVTYLNRTASDISSLWQQNSIYNIIGLSAFIGLFSAWIVIFLMGAEKRLK